jgi:hypothetical protein
VPTIAKENASLVLPPLGPLCHAVWLTGSNQHVSGPARWVTVVKDSGKKRQLHVWRHFLFWLAGKPILLPAARTFGFFLFPTSHISLSMIIMLAHQPELAYIHGFIMGLGLRIKTDPSHAIARSFSAVCHAPCFPLRLGCLRLGQSWASPPHNVPTFSRSLSQNEAKFRTARRIKTDRYE